MALTKVTTPLFPRRRGAAKASVSRLLDFRALGGLVPLLAEDEHRSVMTSLEVASPITLCVNNGVDILCSALVHPLLIRAIIPP